LDALSGSILLGRVPVPVAGGCRLRPTLCGCCWGKVAPCLSFPPRCRRCESWRRAPRRWLPRRGTQTNPAAELTCRWVRHGCRQSPEPPAPPWSTPFPPRLRFLTQASIPRCHIGFPAHRGGGKSRREPDLGAAGLLWGCSIPPRSSPTSPGLRRCPSTPLPFPLGPWSFVPVTLIFRLTG